MAYQEVRDWLAGLPKKESKGKINLKDYGGLKKDQLMKIYHSMVMARRIELEEKLLLRKGLCFFFIGCGGKELVDVVAAQLLNEDDPFIGYYRNKAFDVHRGIELDQKMMEAIGDSRGRASGGQLQPSHSCYMDKSILPQASPTGSHALEAAGLGDAIKRSSANGSNSGFTEGRWGKDAVVFCSIGEGSTSSPEFGRAVFYTAFGKTPNIFAIYNCGWAISTSVNEQFPEGNPTTPFEGFQRFGLMIDNFDGTDLKESLKAMKKVIDYVRSGKGPALLNINVVRLESHSGSDDQTHYMELDTQNYHIENDPLRRTATYFIEDGICTADDLIEMFETVDKQVQEKSREIVASFKPKQYDDIVGKVTSYTRESAAEKWQKLVDEKKHLRVEKYKEFHEKGYFNSPDLPENLPPMTMRKAINYTLFDLFIMSESPLLFGQDVADFILDTYEKGEKVTSSLKGKGGVFLISQNMMRAFGPKRVFNTPLDEAGILGRAIGQAYQGRVPFPEIQFIDYISPAYQQLKDRIATAYQRSNRQVQLPMVIRTSYGGYKQGAGSMWHSEANLGAFINIPGIHCVVPTNGYDAAGLMRTAFVSGDPVLYLEAVALYNRRDWDGYNMLTKFPPIEELIPFGEAKVYNENASDLLMITYGINTPMCLKTAEDLKGQDINARVLDLRTVKPIDYDSIKKHVEDCNKVMIVSEDRYHGGVGPTVSAYIANSLFDSLDAPIKILHATDSRVAYGLDGEEVCLPTLAEIKSTAEELANY